jgi:hypothetical protein
MFRPIRTISMSTVAIISLFCSLQTFAAAPLVINEFMASNRNSMQDAQDENDDWIEIYNTGGVPINIGGMYLTDDLSVPDKWRIPDSTIIQANGYLLIWADKGTGEDGLHTNFKLSAGGEQIGLFDTDGSTLIDGITFGEQTTDVSYGRFPDAADNWRLFDSPTPGAENNGGYIGEVPPLAFSHKRSFYDTPFTVTIATETEGASIFYTLDGSTPYDTEMNAPRGRYYTGPITISSTTCLRSIAVKNGWKPSTVETHTYIFVNDVIHQTRPSGYPREWFYSSGLTDDSGDYYMDPDVYNDPSYSQLMDDALLSLPTISIVTDKANLFDPDTGIYMNTEAEGSNLEWERPTSVEFITPDGSEEFQADCGLRIQGGHSRKPEKCPKHSFSLRFRDIYGPTRLDYKLFGDNWPVGSFDTLHLRGYFNNAWTHWGADQRERAQFTHDQWARDTLTEMGNQDALQGFVVHLYINGLYWGIYNLHERPDADHYAAYNDGDSENIDAINGDPDYVISDPLNTGSVSDGTIDAWHDLKDVVASRNWHEICKVLDVNNFIDWTILNFFEGNTDIKRGTNWRAAGGGPQHKAWRFYSWDAEHIFENRNQTGMGVEDPTGLYSYLDDIEEFRIRFGDRVHKHLFNNGALTTQRNIDRWVKLSDEVQLAVIAESARWGDYRRDVHPWRDRPYRLYTKNDFWIPENNHIINDYLPYRTAYAIANVFRSRGLYPNIDAPVFNINDSYQHVGRIEPSDRLSMSSTTGTIYYTLDGSDPRIPQSQQTNTSTTTLITENATKRVLVPTGFVNNNWKGGGVFDQSSWQLCVGGPGGVGYERSPGDNLNYESLITLDLEEQMYNGNTTCYIRIPFVCSDEPDDLSSMTLRIRYDDGFIAYLNGVEVARRNFSGTPTWQSSANSTHSDAQAVNFEEIDISSSLGSLKQGSNILAIQGLNAESNSSDLLFSIELVAGIDDVSDDDIISSGALRYSGPIVLNRSTNVKSRVLSNNNWSALNEATYSVGLVAENLRITEIMYHPQMEPADVNDPNEEFIELTNIGDEPINLNLASFTNGIDFTFPDIELAPGGFVVVVEDIDAFESQYGTSIPIAGQYSGKLNNNGERIRLEDAIGQTILDFSYSDNWRSITDGEGFSLTIIDPANPDPNSWNEKDSWRASADIDGSPGFDDSGIVPNPGAVVINELLANSPGNEPDWIELYNTTNSSINIGGWFLSDSRNNLTKYQIAEGTTISPNQYIVFTQAQDFGNEDDPGCNEPFALSNNGETVILSSGQDGALTGYRDVEDFGASQTGVSFGRYYKSSTDNYNFVAMESETPGSANADPKVGPVVFKEIMYNPDWPDGGSYTNEQYEYIELYNISTESVNLQGWKFTNGIDFTFPEDTTVTMPAGGYILVVREPDAFELRYPSVDVEKIFGPYEGQLSNAGESLELGMPNGDTNSNEELYYIRIDRVNYSDGSHPEDCPGGVDLWPPEADGEGLSLHRIVVDNYGNDPDNWRAYAPSPGE